MVVSLRRLGVPGEEPHAVLEFAWTVIDQTGHRPEVFVDLKGAGALGEAALYGFDPRRGAIVNDPGEGSGGGDAAALWRVRGETVRVLRHLAAGSPLGAEGFSKGPITRALKLLCFYFRELVGTQPHAIGTMLEGLTTGPVA